MEEPNAARTWATPVGNRHFPAFCPSRDISNEGTLTSTLTDAVADYIVMNMVPISVVELEGFRNI